MMLKHQHLLMISCGDAARIWRVCFPAFVALILAISLFIGSSDISFGQFGVATNLSDEDDDQIAVVAERQFVITEQQFDQMVFGGQQGLQGVQVVQGVNRAQNIVVFAQPAATNFRQRVEATANAEIAAVDRHVSLTEAQKKKLKLAVRGDIVQLVSRADDLRPKLTSKPMNQQQYVELMRELQPLRISQQFGIIGENSLFRKTLRTVLTDEQRVRFRTLEREQQAAHIETAMQNIERVNNGLKLTGETRRKFAELILEHGRVPQNVGPYGRDIVLLEANLLRDRVKPLLSEAEWEKFEWGVGLAKRVEPTLGSYGLWTARRSKTNDEETDDETKD